MAESQSVTLTATKDGAMTVSEACSFLGVGRTLLYELMHRGEIRFSQVTEKKRVVLRASCVEFLNKRLAEA